MNEVVYPVSAKQVINEVVYPVGTKQVKWFTLSARSR